MPKGPNGEKRPADAIGLAVMVGRIATGEIEDPKSKATGKTKSGLAGAKARVAATTPQQRSEIARKAAQTRWE